MTLEQYHARDGWRWRIRARNGRTVATSGESYHCRATMGRIVARVMRPMPIKILSVTTK